MNLIWKSCVMEKLSSWPMRMSTVPISGRFFLTFFFRFMRPLIEEGHIYLGTASALSSLARGKQHVLCVYPIWNATGYMAELSGGATNVDIQRYKGLGEMDSGTALGNDHESGNPNHAAS